MFFYIPLYILVGVRVGNRPCLILFLGPGNFLGCEVISFLLISSVILRTATALSYQIRHWPAVKAGWSNSRLLVQPDFDKECDVKHSVFELYFPVHLAREGAATTTSTFQLYHRIWSQVHYFNPFQSISLSSLLTSIRNTLIRFLYQYFQFLNTFFLSTLCSP